MYPADESDAYFTLMPALARPVVINILEDSLKIYVGNLPFSTTEDELRETFEAYGDVEEVKIITDRETGRPRGFGFVTMTNDDEAQRAIDGLNSKDLGGRSIVVNEARPRNDEGGRRRQRW